MSIYSSIESNLSFLESLKRRQQQEVEDENKIHTARDKYLSNKRTLTKDVGFLTGQLLPERAKVKKAAYGGFADHAAIDDAFADDNPLKGLGAEVMDIASFMEGKRLQDTGPELTQKIFTAALSRRLDAAHRYKLKQETSVFGDDVGNIPFYDQFREQWEQTEGKADRSDYAKGLTPSGLVHNAKLLTGANVAAEVAGRTLPKVGIKALPLIGKTASLAGRGLMALPPMGAGGFFTKLGGLALTTLGGMALFDATDEVIHESRWAKARPDEEWKADLASLVIGGAAGIRGEKYLARSVKKAMRDSTMNKLATRVLQKEGTVKSLMEYNISLKKLARSNRTTQSQVDAFKARNRSRVNELEVKAFEKENTTSIFNQTAKVQNARREVAIKENVLRRTAGGTKGADADTSILNPRTVKMPGGKVNQLGATQFDAVADVAGWNKIPTSVQDNILGTTPTAKIPTKTPLLPAPDTHLLLSPPAEAAFGQVLSPRARLATRVYYDSLKGASRGVIELGEHGPAALSNDSMLKMHKFMSLKPGFKLPRSMFLKEEGAVIDKINAAIGKATDGPINKSLLSQNYGIEGKSYSQLLSGLDKPAVKELKGLVGDGIPSEIGVHIAALKSAARKAHSTVKKSAERGAKVSKAAETTQTEGVKKTSTILRRKAKGETKGVGKATEGLSKEEQKKLTSKGAEATPGAAVIAKDPILPKSFKPTADVPVKETLEAIKKKSGFGPAAMKEIEKQLTTSNYNAKTIKGDKLNAILANARANKTIHGKPIVKTQADTVYDDPSVDEMARAFLAFKESKMANNIVKAMVIVPTASVGLLGTDITDAEASALGKVSMLAVDVAKQKGLDTGAKMIAFLNKTNLIAEKGTKLGQVARWQDGVSVVPGLEAVKTGETKVLSVLRNHVMTPGAVADLFYDNFASPVVEMASRMTAVHNNSQMHFQAVKEILEMVPGYKNVTPAIRKAMKPLVKKYEVSLGKASYHEGMMKQMRKDLKKGGKKMDAEVRQMYEEQLAKSESIYKAAKEDLKPYQAEWETEAKKLAAEHSSTRISLAMEDTADFKYYPWLKNMLSPDEVAAVSKLKDLSKVTEGRILAAGGDVIKQRPFAHHAIHPDTNFRSIRKGIGAYTKDGLAYARLHSRSVGSRMMMPDVEYMYSKYIPDVEKRLQMMEFWKKGKRGGWDAHKKDLVKFGKMTPQLEEFWKLIDNSFKPPANSNAAEWSRRYYSLEVARLLFLSPSVGFKHLMKQTGNFALFETESLKAGIRAPKVQMEAAGLKAKERWATAFKDVNFTPSEEAKFVKAVTNQGKFSSAIAEFDIQDAPVGFFDEMLNKFNEAGSVIVGSIENFDRTATALAGMQMAAKKGLTPSQATYALYDSILRANFLSGPLNPKWVRDPFARAFFMFQGTPYKLMEQRILRMMKAGGDVKRAVGVTYDELKAAKMLAKEGEFRVKNGMIMDALAAGSKELTKTKDVYGNSVTRQFMINALTLGGLIGGGKMLWDADMRDHVLHPPFFKPGASGVGLALNPAISSAYKALHAKHEDDSDLFFTEFWNKWMSSTGPFPATYTKALRLSKDDIPEIYQGDAWKYIFAVPAISEK